MNDNLYNEATAAVEMLQELEAKVKSLDKNQIEDFLYGVWRKLQVACHQYMQQGPRLPLKSEYYATCPLCKEDLMYTKDLEDHLVEEHSIPRTDAEDAAGMLEKQYIDEITHLREILPRYTGVMIEDEDPFVSEKKT